MTNDTITKDKLKYLLQIWPIHTVITTSWLLKHGFTHDNATRYLRSRWMESVGRGAYKRPNDTVSWDGALFGLQSQFPMRFHVGGRTALELLGAAHFVPFGKPKLFLFANQHGKLPIWFSKYLSELDVPFAYLQHNLFTSDVGFTSFPCGDFDIRLSSRERAALEVAELLGNSHDFEECRLLFENLSTLRPKLVQKLLMVCKSIKAKRVFLFLSKNLGHSWGADLDLSQIDLGSGPRDLCPGGTYDPHFQITYPKGFFDDDRLEV